MCYYPKTESLAMPFAMKLYCGENDNFPLEQFQYCRVKSVVKFDIATWTEAKHFYDNEFNTVDTSLDEETFKKEILFLKRKQKKEKRHQPNTITDNDNTRKRRKQYDGHYQFDTNTPSPSKSKRGGGNDGHLVDPPGNVIIFTFIASKYLVVKN